jgi:hypothetical protein
LTDLSKLECGDDRHAGELWTFFLLEVEGLPILFFVIALSSLVAVVLKKGLFWYHPLLPIVLFFLARAAKERFHEGLLAATLFTHEKELSTQYGDPKRTLDIMSDMRMKAEAKVGGLPFIELYTQPRTFLAWMFFVLMRLLSWGSLIALTLWAVFNRMSFVELLVITVICRIASHLLQRATANYLFKIALERWTLWHLACIERTPDLKCQIQLMSHTDDTSLPRWLKMEITRLYQLGVHPDYFRFSKDHLPD